MSWLSGHSAGATIRDLYEHAERVREEQVARALRKMANLSQREREQLEIFSVQLTNALLHQPVSQLWDADNAPGNADALRRLFCLGDLDAGEDEGDAPRSRTTSAA
jgi:glutamyl-tRNA reductase